MRWRSARLYGCEGARPDQGRDANHDRARWGTEFRIVRNIITNFHQPKSTLLLLVSAFAGKDWRRIYDYALSHDFRFLSYGDSSVLMR